MPSLTETEFGAFATYGLPSYLTRAGLRDEYRTQWELVSARAGLYRPSGLGLVLRTAGLSSNIPVQFDPEGQMEEGFAESWPFGGSIGSAGFGPGSTVLRSIASARNIVMFRGSTVSVETSLPFSWKQSENEAFEDAYSFASGVAKLDLKGPREFATPSPYGYGFFTVKECSSVSTAVPDLIFSVISEIFEINDAIGVSGFLRIHPSLTGLLIEARTKIEQYFDSEPDLVLTMSIDPEEPVRQELLIKIRTSMPAEKALEILDRLDAEWWLEAHARAQGTANVILEFK